MAMLLAAANGAFADTSIFACLAIDGVARLECACRDMRELILEGAARGACIAHSHALADVSLQGEVRAAAGRGAARGPRLEVKRLLFALASVHKLVPGRAPLAVATLEGARELWEAVARGLDTAGALAEASGSARRVVVGHFFFSNATAIPAEIVSLVGGDLRGDLGSVWSVSAPLCFSLPRSAGGGEGGRSRRRAAGRGAEMELCLRLAWRGDSVLARITKPGASMTYPLPSLGEEFGRELLLDVRALGSAPLLRSRGTLLRVGGLWKKVSGVCAARLPRAELAEVLSAGLACVICVRDTAPCATAERSRCVFGASSQCANALNLEVQPPLERALRARV